MKKTYRLCTLISALAGYLELGCLIWWYLEKSHQMLGMLGLYAIVVISSLINLLFGGGYFLEKWYAKKRELKEFFVPTYLVIPGILLNLVITILGSGCLILFLYFLFGKPGL